MAQPLCELADLPEGGTLEVTHQDKPLILVHRHGQVRAFLNWCPHWGVSLNCLPNVFFDVERRYIQCANHGALFEPDSGHCVHGPCHGQDLIAVDIELRDNKVWALETD